MLGNKAASGTAIIEELGDEHLATGKLIVYTSADSVFQIAAHDQVCEVDELYRVCEIAREMLMPPHQVSRVIARPFTGDSGQFTRTPYRHDYSIQPPDGLVLTSLQDHGVKVLSIGKIYDLYAGTGIDETFPSKSNDEGMAQLARLYAECGNDPALIMLNLVDFDMLWGHRNDPDGMKKGLEEFDAWLPVFLDQLDAGDLLLMTADHGNDPTTPSTDHSRELVPIMAYLAGKNPGRDLGLRRRFHGCGCHLGRFFRSAGSPQGNQLSGSGHRSREAAGQELTDEQQRDLITAGLRGAGQQLLTLLGISRWGRPCWARAAKCTSGPMSRTPVLA